MFELPAIAGDKLIQIAAASERTVQLSTETKQTDKKIAANPLWADAFVQSIRVRYEHKWQQIFAFDMDRAFRQDAGRLSVPFEYQPNAYDFPAGVGAVMYLTDAVLRVDFPCNSISSVDSLIGDHGWLLLCDERTNLYRIALVGEDWKLSVLSPRTRQLRPQDRR